MPGSTQTQSLGLSPLNSATRSRRNYVLGEAWRDHLYDQTTDLGWLDGQLHTGPRNFEGIPVTSRRS